MPNRPRAGQSQRSPLAGYLLDRLFNGSPEEQRKKDYDAEFKQFQREKSYVDDLDREKSQREKLGAIQETSDILRLTYPELSPENAYNLAHRLHVEVGAQKIRDLGLQGALASLKSTELSNATAQENLDQARRVNPSKGDKEIAENQRARGIAVADAPYAEDIARVAREQNAAALQAQQYTNRFNEETFGDRVKTPALENQRQRLANQESYAKQLMDSYLYKERLAAEARKLAQPPTSTDKYLTIVRPGEGENLYEENYVENPNYRPPAGDAFLGGSVVSGVDPNKVDRLSNGGVVAPIINPPTLNNATPSSQSVDAYSRIYNAEKNRFSTPAQPKVIPIPQSTVPAAPPQRRSYSYDILRRLLLGDAENFGF